jgi:hypothetical protein
MPVLCFLSPYDEHSPVSASSLQPSWLKESAWGDGNLAHAHFTASSRRVLHSCRRHRTSSAFTDPSTSSRVSARFERTLLLTVYCFVMRHLHEPPDSPFGWSLTPIPETIWLLTAAKRCWNPPRFWSASPRTPASFRGSSRHPTEMHPFVAAAKLVEAQKKVSGVASRISLHHGFPRPQLTSLLISPNEVTLKLLRWWYHWDLFITPARSQLRVYACRVTIGLILAQVLCWNRIYLCQSLIYKDMRGRVQIVNTKLVCIFL